MELYKDTLYDLLSSKDRKEDCAVELREDPKAGVKIVNLTEVRGKKSEILIFVKFKTFV